MDRCCTLKIWLGAMPMALLCTAAVAQTQVASLKGKVHAVAPHGITLLPEDADQQSQPVFVAAGRKTQVRINVLANPDKIQAGAYVEMRVLWDGQSALKASSIKFPEGRADKVGLFKG